MASFSRKSSLSESSAVNFQIYPSHVQSILQKNSTAHVPLIFTRRITSCRLLTLLRSSGIQIYLTNFRNQFSRKQCLGQQNFILHFPLISSRRSVSQSVDRVMRNTLYICCCYKHAIKRQKQRNEIVETE